MRSSMLEKAIKGQEVLQLEIVELNIKMEDLKQEHEKKVHMVIFSEEEYTFRGRLCSSQSVRYWRSHCTNFH